MKPLYKITLISLIASTALMAKNYEYPSLYKDPRIMATGGANIAVGGEASSLFHNPAGLSGMKASEGLEVELVNLNFAFSENTLDLIDDLDSVPDNDDTAMFKVLEKYQGENNHLTINDYTSVSYRGQKIAWSIGALAGAQLNLQTHALGSSSGLLDVSGYVGYGLVAGISYDWDSKLSVGLGVKAVSGKGVNAQLTMSEVLDLTDDDNDAADTLEEKYMSDFSSTAFDIGAIYKLDDAIPYGTYWHPKVGVSILNIGDTDLGKYATIPMTVNLGYSVQPEFGFLSDWLLAIDYIDLLNAYEDDYDADMAKRWRLGVQASLFNNSWIQMTGRGGLYNAEPTYGLEFRFTMLTLSYSSYAEAMGAYASQNVDRRHNFSLMIGW